ncbi:MAG: glycosyltransferase [Polyangiaceae bacterium]|nr:glycosyltransferase [Polyangiaceae bacterium]
MRTECQLLAAQGHEIHVIAPASPDGTLAADNNVILWPIQHAGAFGWPGAAARLRAAPWKIAGAAAFATLATQKVKHIHPQKTIAQWLVPSAYPIACSTKIPSEVETVAHGADIRLLLALPAPLRSHIVSRIVAVCSSIRFAANATLQALLAKLPSNLQQILDSKAKVQPPPIEIPFEIPNVSNAANLLRHPGSPTPHASKLAVAVSRLVTSKRVDIAVRATSLLHPEFQLVVIGDGPERANLARLAGANRGGTEQVRFLGAIPRNDTLAWIAAADVLVHMSSAEAAPTVIREARMLGTAVVSTDCGDVSFWSRTDPGIDVVQPDPVIVAASIARMSALQRNPVAIGPTTRLD